MEFNSFEVLWVLTKIHFIRVNGERSWMNYKRCSLILEHWSWPGRSVEVTSVCWLLNSSLFRTNAASVSVCMWILSSFFFMMCWFSSLFPLWKKTHGEAGVTMCDANLPSVSCVSVQSSNTSDRVRRPQSDAISEYIYSGANQNLNRPCLPHVFPVFFF